MVEPEEAPCALEQHARLLATAEVRRGVDEMRRSLVVAGRQRLRLAGAADAVQRRQRGQLALQHLRVAAGEADDLLELPAAEREEVLPDPDLALLRRRLRIGGGLLLFGVARLGFGLVNHEPVGYLVLIDAVLLLGTICLLGSIPLTTLRGRAALKRWRRDHETPKRDPASGGNAVLAAALFGGAALWLAEPEFAHAFAVPRESAPGSGGGGGGGDGGGGAGGCGGCGGGCGG